MTAAALQESARRQQTISRTAYPQSMTLDGKRYDVAAIAGTGMIEDAKGGFRMGRTATITLPWASVAESVLFDATTGNVKRQNLTLGTGTATITYRVKRVTADPHRITWRIEAVESVM